MTDKIEKEFFEAFNVPEEYFEFVSNGKIFTANTMEGFKTKYPGDILIGGFRIKKRTVTAEIIYRLEEILLRMQPRRTSKFIEYCINVYDEYVIRFRNTINHHPDVAVGKTRQDALLNLCIKLKNVIQEEVKELFNDK